MYIFKHYINGVEVPEEETRNVVCRNMTTEFVYIPDNVKDRIDKIEFENIIIENIGDNADIDEIMEKAKLIYKHRNNKDYESADKIRNELIEKGYTVKYK